MALTSYAGGAVFARRHGAGDPDVVALHGWGRRSDDFAPLLGGRNALAVDLPGFGASPPPPGPVGARGYAEMLVPVFTALAAPPVVIGHSFGGRVAVALAASHPELVRGLILTGVPLLRRADARRPSWSYRALRLAHRVRLVSDERMEAIRRNRGSADYRAAEGVMRDVLVAVVNESYETEMAGLSVPVDLVWGALDVDTPVEVATRAAALMDDAGVDVDLEVVGGAGHFLPIERPDVIGARLDGDRWR